MTRRDVISLFGVLVFLIASAVVVNPFFEHPVYDDWAYAKNVLRFLEDGRLYFVWTQTSFVFQFIVGVLFSKVLGFSFSSLHLSTLTLALVGALSLYAILRQLGHGEGTSFLLTMGMTTTVFYFHFMFSFMTDVPSVATALAAVAVECRAQRTRSTFWYVASAVAFTAAILTRDLVGVAVIGLLIQAGWRRELHGARLSLLAPLLVWAGYLAFGPRFITMPWRQMKVIPLASLSAQEVLAAVLLGHVILSHLAFQFAPLLLSLVPQAVRLTLRARKAGTALLVLCLAAPIALAVVQYHQPGEAGRLMPYRSGFLSAYGIYNATPLPGDRGRLIGGVPQMVLTGVAALSNSVVLLAAAFVLRDSVHWLAATRNARRALWIAGATLGALGLLSRLLTCGPARAAHSRLLPQLPEQTVWILCWSGILALLGAAVAILVTVIACAMARRRAPEQYRTPMGLTPVWPVYLYTIASLVFYLVSAKFFVRYALMFVPGLYVLLRHGLGPLRPVRTVVVSLMALSVAAGIVWTKEHIRFNTARWQAGRWLLERNVPPDWIEGGFEFDGWNMEFGAPPRSRYHTPSPFIPQVCINPRFLLTLDTFAPPGRGRHTYAGTRYRWLALFPYESLLERRTRNVVVWGDTALALPLPPRQ